MRRATVTVCSFMPVFLAMSSQAQVHAKKEGSLGGIRFYLPKKEVREGQEVVVLEES